MPKSSIAPTTTRSRLVATEACRIAANGQDFLDRVQTETGLDIEILSREAEARLAVSGCAALLDARSDLALVFDIGGGSSELIWLDLELRGTDRTRSLADRVEAQNCIAAWTSLPVGVVTLAERFGGRHVIREDFDAMVDYVHSFLEPFEAEHRFREQMRHRRAHLLGTSGTVTTVAGIHLGLRRYDRSRVDGCWMRTSQARAVTQSLIDRATPSAWRSLASAASALIWCSRVAPFSRRSRRLGPVNHFASPIEGCAKGSSHR